jgi:hypothetical protein
MTHAILIKFGACSEGVVFASKYHTLQEAWDACENPIWMTWFLKKLKLQKRVYVEVAVELAKHVLPLFEKEHPTDERPRKAVEVAANWLRIGKMDFADDAAYATRAVEVGRVVERQRHVACAAAAARAADDAAAAARAADDAAAAARAADDAAAAAGYTAARAARTAAAAGYAAAGYAAADYTAAAADYTAAAAAAAADYTAAATSRTARTSAHAICDTIRSVIPVVPVTNPS